MLYVNSIPCLIYQCKPCLSSVYMPFNRGWLRERHSSPPNPRGLSALPLAANRLHTLVKIGVPSGTGLDFSHSQARLRLKMVKTGGRLRVSEGADYPHFSQICAVIWHNSLPR